MPFLPVFGGVQVELYHLLDGAVSTTAPNFLERSPGTPADPLELASAVDAWWRTFVLPLLSTSLEYHSYRWRRLDSAGEPVTEVAHVPPITGGIGGAPLPANVSIRVNEQIPATSFGRRGCLFVPGVPRAVVAGNLVDPAWKADLEAAYGELIIVAGANHWEWIVVQKFLHGSLLPAAGRHKVIDVRIDSPWVAQRRSRLHNEPSP